MSATQVSEPSRLLGLPAGKWRNNAIHNNALIVPLQNSETKYRDLFEDGAVDNLTLLQTCKQIYSEAKIIGTLATTFHIKVKSSKVSSNLRGLSHSHKACIQSVSREISGETSLKVLRIMSELCIRPRRVILLANRTSKPWGLIYDYRKFALCSVTMVDVLSSVMIPNPNLRQLIIRKEVRKDKKWPATAVDADEQLKRYREVLATEPYECIVEGSTRLREKRRNAMGLSEVEMSFTIKGESAARSFAVRWEISFYTKED